MKKQKYKSNINSNIDIKQKYKSETGLNPIYQNGDRLFTQDYCQYLENKVKELNDKLSSILNDIKYQF